MRTWSALGLVVVAAGLLSGATAQSFGGFGSVDQKPSSNEVILCADIPPDLRYTCNDQKWWGKCDEAWMFRGAPRDPGSFCAATCRRCPDITPPTEVVIVTIIQVQFTLTLRGMTVDQFGLQQQLDYRKAIAQVAGVSEQLVVINRIEPHSYGIRVTSTVSFPSDMSGGQEQAVDSFTQNVNQMNAGGRKRRLSRRLLQDDTAAAEASEDGNDATAAADAELPSAIADNPITNSLSDFGFDIAPEQQVQSEQTDAAVTVPVDTTKTSADAASTDDELLGAQIQAKAAADVDLQTPQEAGVAVGETKTVGVPEAAQAEAETTIAQGTGDVEAIGGDAATDSGDDSGTDDDTTADTTDVAVSTDADADTDVTEDEGDDTVDDTTGGSAADSTSNKISENGSSGKGIGDALGTFGFDVGK